MTWLIFGGLLFFAGFLLVQALVGANPRTLANIIRYSAASVLILLSLRLAWRAGVGAALPLVALALMILGWRGGATPFGMGGLGRAFGRAQKSSGQTSEIATKTLQVTLDHDSGQMDGEVLVGGYQGRTLSSMNIEELLELLRFCRAGDGDAAALLETYLERHRSEELDSAAYDNGPGYDRQSLSGQGGAMSSKEAYAILGLEPGASDKDIANAHRHLMKKLHPDQGGSTYLATKINRAKEVLLDK
jgi:hypothetical protein